MILLDLFSTSDSNNNGRLTITKKMNINIKKITIGLVMLVSFVASAADIKFA